MQALHNATGARSVRRAACAPVGWGSPEVPVPMGQFTPSYVGAAVIDATSEWCRDPARTDVCGASTGASRWVPPAASRRAGARSGQHDVSRGGGRDEQRAAQDAPDGMVDGGTVLPPLGAPRGAAGRDNRAHDDCFFEPRYHGEALLPTRGGHPAGCGRGEQHQGGARSHPRYRRVTHGALRVVGACVSGANGFC